MLSFACCVKTVDKRKKPYRVPTNTHASAEARGSAAARLRHGGDSDGGSAAARRRHGGGSDGGATAIRRLGGSAARAAAAAPPARATGSCFDEEREQVVGLEVRGAGGSPHPGPRGGSRPVEPAAREAGPWQSRACGHSNEYEHEQTLPGGVGVQHEWARDSSWAGRTIGAHERA